MKPQTKYKLSPGLASLFAESMTRRQVVKKFWAYIKDHDLQDPDNKRMIVPDRALMRVVGREPVDMLKLSTTLNRHLEEVPDATPKKKSRKRKKETLFSF